MYLSLSGMETDFGQQNDASHRQNIDEIVRRHQMLTLWNKWDSITKNQLPKWFLFLTLAFVKFTICRILRLDLEAALPFWLESLFNVKVLLTFKKHG